MQPTETELRTEQNTRPNFGTCYTVPYNTVPFIQDVDNSHRLRKRSNTAHGFVRTQKCCLPHGEMSVVSMSPRYVSVGLLSLGELYNTSPDKKILCRIPVANVTVSGAPQTSKVTVRNQTLRLTPCGGTSNFVQARHRMCLHQYGC